MGRVPKAGRVIVTRPAEDAERIAAPLRARGAEVVVAPLLAVVTETGPPLVLGDTRAFLLTSANGVRALAARLGGPPPPLPTLCVGEQTARVAASLGFADIRAAGGDVESLAGLVRSTLPPGPAPLLHAAGSVVAGDLAMLLAGDGYRVERAVLYRAETAAVLPPDLAAELASGAARGLFLFSPRTAATFSSLARAAGLGESVRGMTAYCLSQAVADKLGGLPFRAVRVAAVPAQDALLAIFDADSAAQGDQP